MIEYRYVDANIDGSVSIVTIRGNGFGRTFETNRIIVEKATDPTVAGSNIRIHRK